jgi:hypothetical protein
MLKMLRSVEDGKKEVQKTVTAKATLKLLNFTNPNIIDDTRRVGDTPLQYTLMVKGFQPVISLIINGKNELSLKMTNLSYLVPQTQRVELKQKISVYTSFFDFADGVQKKAFYKTIWVKRGSGFSLYAKEMPQISGQSAIGIRRDRILKDTTIVANYQKDGTYRL